MPDLLAAADIERMRRNAIMSQNRRDVAAWTFVLFEDGPLAGLRIRIPEPAARSKFLGFTVLTQRGVIQAVYRMQDGVPTLVEVIPNW